MSGGGGGRLFVGPTHSARARGTSQEEYRHNVRQFWCPRPPWTHRWAVHGGAPKFTFWTRCAAPRTGEGATGKLGWATGRGVSSPCGGWPDGEATHPRWPPSALSWTKGVAPIRFDWVAENINICIRPPTARQAHEMWRLPSGERKKSDGWPAADQSRPGL